MRVMFCGLRRRLAILKVVCRWRQSEREMCYRLVAMIGQKFGGESRQREGGGMAEVKMMDGAKEKREELVLFGDA